MFVRGDIMGKKLRQFDSVISACYYKLYKKIRGLFHMKKSYLQYWNKAKKFLIDYGLNHENPCNPGTIAVRMGIDILQAEFNDENIAIQYINFQNNPSEIPESFRKEAKIKHHKFLAINTNLGNIEQLLALTVALLYINDFERTMSEKERQEHKEQKHLFIIDLLKEYCFQTSKLEIGGKNLYNQALFILSPPSAVNKFLEQYGFISKQLLTNLLENPAFVNQFASTFLMTYRESLARLKLEVNKNESNSNQL